MISIEPAPMLEDKEKWFVCHSFYLQYVSSSVPTISNLQLAAFNVQTFGNQKKDVLILFC